MKYADTQLRQIVCRIAKPAEVPSIIMLCPAGLVNSTNGQFLMDREAALLCIEAFDRHGIDLVVDYEHQSVGGQYSAPNGKAPAAGWITNLSWRPASGLYGDVLWSVEAADDLKARRYRYLSPVTLIRREDMRVIKLHSVALTNTPAIVRMKAVANKTIINSLRTFKMDEKQVTALRQILGLPDSATAEDILTKARETVAENADAGSEPSANSTSRTLDMTRVVNKADYDAAVNRADAAEKKLQANDMADFIRRGLSTGKIVAFAQPKWEALFAKDRELAEDMLSTAPLVGHKDGRVVPPETSGGGIAGRRDRTSIIANAVKAFGNDPSNAKISDLKSFVNGELVQANMARMTADEAVRVGV